MEQHHQSDPEITPPEYPHWPRVYIAVLIVTAAVIISLALFSSAFSS